MSLIRFEATLYAINDWTVLLLPKEISGQLPSRGQVMVKGTINDVAFQTALEPDGRGSHWLHVTEAMQKAIKAKADDKVRVALESTKEWPEPEIPADIKKGLADHGPVKERWQSVTPLARWEWIRWINSTNQAETRQHRIEVAESKLLAGERRPCCFNRNMCCVPQVSKTGMLIQPKE
jgi:hypothetical protein